MRVVPSDHRHIEHIESKSQDQQNAFDWSDLQGKHFDLVEQFVR